jgi:hypothetical protein
MIYNLLVQNRFEDEWYGYGRIGIKSHKNGSK